MTVYKTTIAFLPSDKIPSTKGSHLVHQSSQCKLDTGSLRSHAPFLRTHLGVRRHRPHVRISGNDALRSLVNGFDIVIEDDICDYELEALDSEPAAGTSEWSASTSSRLCHLGW